MNYDWIIDNIIVPNLLKTNNNLLKINYFFLRIAFFQKIRKFPTEASVVEGYKFIFLLFFISNYLINFNFNLNFSVV